MRGNFLLVIWLPETKHNANLFFPLIFKLQYCYTAYSITRSQILAVGIVFHSCYGVCSKRELLLSYGDPNAKHATK